MAHGLLLIYLPCTNLGVFPKSIAQPVQFNGFRPDGRNRVSVKEMPMSTQILSSSSTCLLSKKEAALHCRLKKVVEGGPAAIDERLNELSLEWTAGRAAKSTAGLMIVAGLALTAFAGPVWLILTAVGGAIMLPYLFGRRSPLSTFYHRLGLRTGQDVDHEKMALKALRGDFLHLPTVHHVEDKEAINRMEGEGGIVYEPDDSKVDAESAVRDVIGAARL